MAEKTPGNTEEYPKSALAKREEEILSFWQDKKIFEKSLEKTSPKGNFVFYDGPPFATGLPHYGHILPSTIKDAIPRYKTMNGFHVERKWGWDCHGLPIENIVEKDLKVSGRKEIEALGVDVFNEHARSMVLNYVHEWKKTVDRIGRWVDFDGSYKTMDNTYMESVWWALKKIHEEDKLIYESVRVLPYCPRCETPIANSEIAMDNSYKDITDISVYVKFKLVDEDAYMLAWTTTPWTLPGNTALAVNKEVIYAKVKKEGVMYILAKESVEKVMKADFEILSLIKGEELVGKSYEPVFDYYKDIAIPNKERIWKVWHADFVTIEKGTGIAHEAPAFGEEDMFLAQQHDIPFIKHVGNDGRFTKEVTDLAGQLVKPKPTKEEPALHQSADVEIIKKLAKQGSLFAKEKIIHSYPHCFRCETPLFYFAIPAWFIEIQSIKDKLMANNEKINWIPDHLKEGRFKKSMEGAPDWNISRNRFWATPLPFWKCAACAKLEVLGSIADIKTKTKRNTYYIMRHGEGDHNVQNILSSDSNNPHHLTERGMEQVSLSAQSLVDKNIDLIIASPFVRTKETADVIVETIGYKGERLTDERLKEFNFGDFNGQSSEKYHTYYDSVGERLTKRLPKGENINDVRERIGDFIYDIDSKYEGKNILLITHGGPATILYTTSVGGDDKKIIEMWGLDQDFLGFGQMVKLDFANVPHNKKYELDLHRPYIDSVHWKCECGGEVKRVPEVIDCWFESGSMPFAQKHYPFENEEWFKNNFPSQFVAEYIAQTRTWFYYMHVVSTVLFDSHPFDNVVTTGNVLAEDGQKMSKSKNNFPDPWLVINKYGVDPIRYYLLSSPVMRSEDMDFSEKGVDEIYKKILQRLNNVVTFYEMYSAQLKSGESKTSTNVLDQWIVARLNQLITEVTENMERYELDKATRPFADFVDDLSTWYLRRSRDRFKGDNEEDKQAALSTTRFVLQELSKVMAPFMPFIAEDIYQKVKAEDGKESVHLDEWPVANRGMTDQELLKQMTEVRQVVSLGLEARMKAGIKVRQPLGVLRVRDDSTAIGTLTHFVDLIKDEVNVKEVVMGASITDAVELDTTLTPELKTEGQMRELLRTIQDLRKEGGLNVEDEATLFVETDKAGKVLLQKYEREISKTAGLIGIAYEVLDTPEIKIDDLTFKLKVTK